MNVESVFARGGRAIEAVAYDIAFDKMAAKSQPHFVGARTRGTDEARAARLKRLDRADADPLRKAKAPDLLFGQGKVHGAAHLDRRVFSHARMAAATS